jgi:ABC-type xylose transport system permease subunit
MLSRAVAIWLLLLVVAVFNGALRERLITPRFGEQGSHIVSTAILAAAIFLVAWISVSWIGPKNGLDAMVIGIVWVALTVAFEFLAGQYAFGNSWERLIADYNVFSGRIWILVLAANLLAPLWAFSQKQPL